MNSSRKRNRTNNRVSPLAKLSLVAAISVSSIAFTIPTASASWWTTAFSWVQNKLLTSQQNDAFKTAVSQDSVGTNALAETVLMAKHKLATAEQMLSKKVKLMELYEEFMSPGANTNNSRCYAVNERANDQKVPERTQLYVKADIINNINSGGFDSEVQRIDSLQTMKFSIACTLEQAKQGYCTPSMSGGQYFDSDFGMFFSSDRLLDSQFLSAKAGIFTIANPTPDTASTENCLADSSCVAAIDKQNKRLAVNSLVANSLLTQLYNRMSVGSIDENKK